MQEIVVRDSGKEFRMKVQRHMMLSRCALFSSRDSRVGGAVAGRMSVMCEGDCPL